MASKWLSPEVGGGLACAGCAVGRLCAHRPGPQPLSFSGAAFPTFSISFLGPLHQLDRSSQRHSSCPHTYPQSRQRLNPLSFLREGTLGLFAFKPTNHLTIWIVFAGSFPPIRTYRIPASLTVCSPAVPAGRSKSQPACLLPSPGLCPKDTSTGEEQE